MRGLGPEVALTCGNLRATGYAIGGRLILTSSYILASRDRAQRRIQARFIGSPEELECEEVWRPVDEKSSVVLLAVSVDTWKRPEHYGTVRWGDIAGNREVPCETLGFVHSAFHGESDSERIVGTIDPRSHLASNRLVMAPDDTSIISARSYAWNGLMGASILSSETIVGVVVGWELVGRFRIMAEPVAKLFRNPAFAALVAQETGIRPEIMVVERPSATTIESARPHMGAAIVELSRERRSESTLPPPQHQAGRDWGKVLFRLSLWLFSGVILESLPVAFGVLDDLFSGQGFHPRHVLESGHLFIVSAIMVAASMLDMQSRARYSERRWPRVFAQFFGMLSFAGNIYAYARVGGAPPDVVVGTSLAFFPPALFVSGVCTALAVTDEQ